MQHFNRQDLTNEFGGIDGRYLIERESMDACDLIIDIDDDWEVDNKVILDDSGEFYYDDDVEFVGVYYEDFFRCDYSTGNPIEDCIECYCFKRKEREK